ncbi:MAG: siderophore-interacting protein [Acidimicrobiales bacterium]
MPNNETGTKGLAATGTAARLSMVIDRLLNRATVSSVTMATPRMRRIRLHSESIASMSWTAGQQVRVLTGDPVSWRALRSAFRDLLRTYSVYDLNGEQSWLELCVLDHGDGPGATWARTVREGDEVHFNSPEGKLVLQSAPYHVFVGEETAMAPFAAMLRSLAPEEAVTGVVEVATPEDRLPLARAEELTWRYRGDAPAASSQTLVEAVKALDLPDAPGFAYIAGESRACGDIRRHLVEDRGWPARQSIIVKPFWTPGKKGLE